MKESRDPADWWRRAIKDFKGARAMYGNDPDDLAEPIWVACQQAFEKMLKAYLLLKGGAVSANA